MCASKCMADIIEPFALYAKMSYIQLLMFGAALLAVAYSACPTGWQSHKGSCYKFQIGRQNWYNARSMCKWHNSDLIVIDDAREQAWFHRKAQAYNYTEDDDGFWIGGTNWQNQGTWRWEPTNRPIGYIVWGSGQPNNRNNSEICLAAVHYFDYKWSDEFCDWQRLGYVCEMTEPTAPVVG